MDDKRDIEQVYDNFDRRFKLKKKVNLVISIIIFLVGIVPMYLVFAVKEGIYALRFLTVNGTLFTMLGALVFVFINLFEIITGKEMTRIWMYFLRLSCAVSESVIMIVVFIGFLLGDPSALDEWDEMVTHGLMPILTIVSFVSNDSPIGKVPPRKRINGTWFITVYGVVVISLIAGGVISMDMIPYPFLNPNVLPPVLIIGAVLLIYLIAFSVATLLYRLNRKLSWLWFR
jgi:hypothetical protein